MIKVSPKVNRYLSGFKLTISAILLICLILIVSCFFISFFLPLKETETIEKGEEGEPNSVSVTVETSPLSIWIRNISIISFLLVFFILIFIVKNEYRFQNFLELGWILSTPFFFLFYYMEYLFQELPCPAHHNLEIPIMFSLIFFVLTYLIMLGILIFEVQIKVGRSILNNRTKVVEDV